MADIDMPTYKGSKLIAGSLSYRGLDEQIRKLDGFEQAFTREMGAAMERAVEIARAHAVENAPRLSGALAGSIYGKRLNDLASGTIRGAIGSNGQGLKAFAQEVGRYYGRAAAGTTRYWKGKFYLYYGAQERREEIMSEYQAANERIVGELAVQA